MRNFVHRSVIEAPVSELFSWHLRDRAFERLTPPWLNIEVKSGAKRLQEGLTIELVARRFGISLDMAFQVMEFVSDKKFVDRQLKGPFAYWLHEHVFEDLADGQSAMRDDVQFELPLGFISEPFFGRYFDEDLLRMFRYRHEVLQSDMTCYMKNRQRPRKKVLLHGWSSGLVEPLLDFLSTQGHKATIGTPLNLSQEELDEHNSRISEILSTGEFDVFIRVGAYSGDAGSNPLTSFLNQFASMSKPLEVFVNVQVSHMPEPSLSMWQRVCEPLLTSSTRCVFASTGTVLSPAFGALKRDAAWKDETRKWIAVDDAIAAIEHCMLVETIAGHVDLSVPHAVNETMTSNQLSSSGYQYGYQSLNAALKHVLGV